MSAVVEHTILDRRIVNDGLIRRQKGTFQLAPMSVELVPRRLGYANGNDDATSITRDGAHIEYVPVTRQSRLAAHSKFTTNFKDKAVKKAFMRLANGEIQGGYEFQMYPRDNDSVGCKERLELVLSVGVPTGTGMTAQQQLQQGFTCLVDGRLRGFLALDANGGWKSIGIYTYDATKWDERFSNTLTLDEKEYLSYRVFHLFFRALAGEFPFLLLSRSAVALDAYYSQRKYFELALDISIVMADVAIATIAQVNAKEAWECASTLLSLANYLVASEILVNHDAESQVCRVRDFICRSYGAKLSWDDCVIVRSLAGMAFLNGHDFDKAQEHLVAGWHTLCQNSPAVGVDISGKRCKSILSLILILYNKMTIELSTRGRGAAQSVAAAAEELEEGNNIYPRFCGLLYLAGFQGGPQMAVAELGPQVAQSFFCPRLDKRSALAILMEAGAQPDAKHFRQILLQVKCDDSFAYVSDIPEDCFPVEQKLDAKRQAKQMKKYLKARDFLDWTTVESCANCGVLKRPDGQPNFRCPCHKASYCSKECQLINRKEHKKICTAVVPKKGK
jgi:hypothetical protein